MSDSVAAVNYGGNVYHTKGSGLSRELPQQICVAEAVDHNYAVIWSSRNACDIGKNPKIARIPLAYVVGARLEISIADHRDIEIEAMIGGESSI